MSYRDALRCLLEGLQWLAGPNARLKVAGDSGISQARRRVGVEPLRKLHDEVVKRRNSSRGAKDWARHSEPQAYAGRPKRQKGGRQTNDAETSRAAFGLIALG